MAIQSGMDRLEQSNDLITLGIQPQNPNTGYGYIQYDRGDQEVHLNRSVFDVRAFTEKPDEETAKRFLSTGEFLWNSGLFLWKAKDIKAALASHLSEIHDAFFKEIRLGSMEKPSYQLRGAPPNLCAMRKHFH